MIAVMCSECKGMVEPSCEDVYCSTCAPRIDGAKGCSGCDKELQDHHERYCEDCAECEDDVKESATVFAAALKLIALMSPESDCLLCQGWPHLPTCVVVRASEFLDEQGKDKEKKAGIKIAKNPCAR